MNREQFLQRIRPKVEALQLDNGETVHVREISGRDLMRVRNSGPDDEQGFRLVLICLSDEEGNRLLTDDDLGSVDIPAGTMNQILPVAMRVNKLDKASYDLEKKD